MARSPMQIVQLALHIVPGTTVALAATLALLTRTPNPIGAIVVGGPPGPDGVVAWRITAVERDHGYYAPVIGTHLRLVAQARGASSSCEGTTDSGGAWEARLPLPDPSADQLEIDVRADNVDRPLVHADVPVRPADWDASFKLIGPQVKGEGQGALAISVALTRGALAAGFPEQAIVHVSHASDGRAAPQTRVRVSGEGFVAEPNGELVTNGEGDVRLRILAQHNSPRVELHASADDEQGAWEATLPVVPGSMWVDPAAMASGRLVVRAPVAHKTAYLTFATRTARLLATSIPLSPDASHGATGEMALPSLPDEPVWVLASPDPQGQGMEREQVAWPIGRAGTSTQARPAAQLHTPRLADGIPEAVRSSRASERAARIRIIGMLAIAALIESVLLFVRARQARQELAQILASHADVDEALLHSISGGERFWIKLVIGSVLIAAIFGALAFLLWIQV